MQQLPHHYAVQASASNAGPVKLDSPGLAQIESAAPAEFGGPGDLWSPETLLAAAIADCFILSFRAIARASKLNWDTLNCDANGVLDRVNNDTQFTHFDLQVTLTVPPDTDEAKALRLLEKAEASCLITNSLKSTTHLDATIVVF